MVFTYWFGRYGEEEEFEYEVSCTEVESCLCDMVSDVEFEAIVRGWLDNQPEDVVKDVLHDYDGEVDVWVADVVEDKKYYIYEFVVEDESIFEEFEESVMECFEDEAYEAYSERDTDPYTSRGLSYSDFM